MNLVQRVCQIFLSIRSIVSLYRILKSRHPLLCRAPDQWNECAYDIPRRHRASIFCVFQRTQRLHAITCVWICSLMSFGLDVNQIKMIGLVSNTISN